MVDATLNVKVEMTTGDGSLLPLPKNLFKTPKKEAKTPKKEALYQTLARIAKEGLFNESHHLLAQPSQPITGPSLAQTWKDKSAVDGHLMSELFEIAKIEYDPESELAKNRNYYRKKGYRPLLSPPEGMPH